MKPLRLEIEGIKSFRQPVEIDFAPLTAGGLFGIFGNTGSGKSSILFCINLALYYDNSFGKKFINTKSKYASVEFAFELLAEGGRNTYIVRREFKNGISSAYLYILKGGVKTCLQEKSVEVTKKITELTGLSYNEFKKCIALPQGEFSAFINATKGDRTKIISGLFSLEEYSEKLLIRARERKNCLDGEYNAVHSRLLEYADVSSQAIEECGEDIKNLERQIALTEKEEKLLQKKYEKHLKVYEINLNFMQAEKSLERLRGEKDKIEKSRQILSGYELFYRLAIDNENIIKDGEKLLKIGENIKKSKEELKNLSNLINSESVRAIETERDAALKKAAALEGLSPANATLQTRSQERLEKLEEYERIKRLASETQGVIDGLIKRLGEFDKECAEEAKEGMARLKNYFLEGEYRESLAYFTAKKALLQRYGQSDLSGAVQREIDLQIVKYSKLIKETAEGDNIQALLKQASGGAGETEAAKIKGRIELEQEKLAASLAKLEQIKSDGARIAGEIKELTSALTKVTGGGDYFTVCTRTQGELKLLEEKKQSEEGRQRELLERLSVLEKSISALEGEQKQLCESVARAEEAFSQRLAKNNIKNADGLSAYNIGEAERKELEANVKRYDDESAAALSDYKKYFEGKDESITGEHIVLLKAEVAASGRLLRERSSALAVAKKQQENLTARLKNKNALTEECKAAEKKLATVESLLKLLSGKSEDRFIDFVAEEYIRETAANASVLLAGLTGGRYDLTFERTDAGGSDFYIRDNLDGGNLRSVSTLSGGETFLVSLALAVSLSESIYKKSLRPMEFFFLDEGFGTLDENLIDVVLNSLEKLKNAHFAIGLISHVQELKERISAKILVTPADEDNGSRVEIVV